MLAGKLRHRITIQTRTDTQDGFGQPVASWVNLVTNEPAEKRDLSGRELIAAQAVHSETTTEFVIRYRSGFDSKARVMFDGDVWTLNAVLDPDGRRRMLRLHCSRGVNEG